MVPTDYEQMIRERVSERTTLRQVITEGITQTEAKPSLRQVALDSADEKRKEEKTE